MSFWSFTIAFIAALVVISTIDILIGNTFVTAFISALVIGFMAAKDN